MTTSLTYYRAFVNTNAGKIIMIGPTPNIYEAKSRAEKAAKHFPGSQIKYTREEVQTHETHL